MTDQEVLEMYAGFVKRMVVPDSMGDVTQAHVWGGCAYATEVRAIHRAASGMTTEAAELLGITHKAVYRGHDWEMNDVIAEAGDVMFFIQALCNAIGITLGELANANIVKLSRRYPDGYMHEMDMNRVDR